MTDAAMTLPDDLSQQLRTLAQQTNQSPEDLLRRLLAAYMPPLETAPEREVLQRVYAYARRYWREQGDDARLSLSDAELDAQFRCIDPEGIPRLWSDNVTLSDDPLEIIADMATQANLNFDSNITAARSRDVLNDDFANDLLKRMGKQDAG
jgi:plasmid stability protein